MHEFHDKLNEGKVGERTLDMLFREFYRIEPATLAEEKAFGFDRTFTCKQTGRRWTVEYKTDARAGDTGNAFIELVSNNKTDAPGWALHSVAQLLMYYVPPARKVFALDVNSIKDRLPAWEKEYPRAQVVNHGYITEGLLVPLDEVEHWCARRVFDGRDETSLLSRALEEAA